MRNGAKRIRIEYLEHDAFGLTNSKCDNRALLLTADRIVGQFGKPDVNNLDMTPEMHVICDRGQRKRPDANLPLMHCVRAMDRTTRDKTIQTQNRRLRCIDVRQQRAHTLEP